MLSKEILRNKFSLIRKKRYFEVRENFFSPILKMIKKNNLRNIACYYPSNYEFNTLKLFKNLKKKKKIKTLLPVILTNKSMKFVSWRDFDPLFVNKFGFLEPRVNKNEIIPDLILVPIVAYDKLKNRLGYGKGYYDRILKQLVKKNPNIITVGLAFSFQKYKKIPISKLDMKLNYILTEKGLY